MGARAPFTDKQIDDFKAALEHTHTAMREIDRAERVGMDVSRWRKDMQDAQKQLSTVIHEYGDDSRP